MDGDDRQSLPKRARIDGTVESAADLHSGKWTELQSGDPRDDEQREAMNASATRFVTEKMLGENTNLVHILANQTFSESVCSNLSARLLSKQGEHPTVKLVYKGGSVMRHMLTKLADDLPQLRTVINEEYQGSFGMSDHDFKLAIEPVTRSISSEDVHRLADAVASTLTRQRDAWFSAEFPVHERDRLFPWLSLNRERQAKDLQEMLQSMPRTSGEGLSPPRQQLTCFGICTGQAGIQPYPGRRDFKVCFKHDVFPTEPELQGDATEATKVMKKVGEQPHYVHVSNNQSLRFERHGRLAHFDLVRAKVSFLLEEKNGSGAEGGGKSSQTKIGGELIDISIAHPDDAIQTDQPLYQLPGKTKGGEMVKPLEEYPWMGGIATYSLPYLIIDVADVIFSQFEVRSEALARIWPH